MYTVYKQLHPPTGVEHCLYCNFLNGQEQNLVIAAVNQIHVYRLNPEAEASTTDKEDSGVKQKLECLASFSLFGNVMSMKSVRLPGATRDALLLAFSDAKLSVVEYDPGMHDLQTTSLHHFEDTKLQDFQDPVAMPTVRVDPDGRCAAMLIYGTKLVVLPFRKDVYSEDVDVMIDGDDHAHKTRYPIQNSYIIDMRSFDEKITNILDFQFLHGYYEPTVFILYEPYPTWAGRVAVRSDTCSIVAISLNIPEKVHPIIWSMSHLPFDCIQCLPVPKPIGGVLVFATNSLLYLNQSVPPYGVSLNSITATCSAFPLNGMRSVRSFNFDKSAASVLTTCMCLCEDGYLFLGSRLGNSLLLRYTEKASTDKEKTHLTCHWLRTLMSWKCTVPARTPAALPSHLTLMGEPAFLSEEFNNTVDPDLELVTTSGYGKNGALSVLQRSIRPQVVTTFELPSCINMWTVTGPPQEGEKGEDDEDETDGHAFLILTRPDSSMGEGSGQEGEKGEEDEMDGHTFLILIRPVSSMTATIYAGNVGEGRFILQVSSGGVRLLDGVQQLQHIPIEMGTPIVYCSVADPYILIMSEEGLVMMLTLKQEQAGARLVLTKPLIANKPRILTMCAYRDESGLFSTTPIELDEDELLYGDADTSTLDTSVNTSIRDDKQSSSTAQDKIQAENMSSINEILLVGLGHQKSRPYLLARSDDGVLIYEAFPYYQAKADNHLKIRFKKVQHNLILKERKVKYRKRGDVEIIDEFDELKDERGQWFRYFNDISGYSGVFICGPYPHWLFMTQRGSLRIHPMGIDGAVTCFAPFHNVNCPKGFLYFNKQGEMRISVLPTHLTYDAPWPIRKVPLRCTPHFIVYHMDSKTYAVVMHNPDICNKLPKATSDDKEFEVFEKDERFVYPVVEKFMCQLYSPTSWEVIPNTQIEMEEFEHVTGIKYVPLKSEETVSGYKGYIAIGTNHCLGEDILGRGRIIIFDVIEVVPEPGQPLTKNKIKLFMWTLKDNDLVGIAFIDTHIYIHQLVTLKSLIFAADVQKSVTLYRYQEEERVLSQVSRDVKPLEVYTLDFVVDGAQLSFAVTDKLKNIIIYHYLPETRESHGGTRLIRRADFNAGSHINTMFRVRCKLTDPSTEKKLSGPVERRHVTYFATLDGSIGLLLPINEKTYRRLLMLQNALSIQMPHTAGLNPKSYRAMKTDAIDLFNSHKNILDGELLWKFLHLSVLERNEMAKRIGTTVEQLVEDLMEIDRLTAHF
ncbi:CPSF1-like protein [Mya arenaria]|uniref:CPSF1-like protein n=1 Tax=Mya arenaria TaxID=6604 RepID=A0ABY7EUQ6_MYAAR|nr:CPSF1-like protein [Mya arenaria]